MLMRVAPVLACSIHLFCFSLAASAADAPQAAPAKSGPAVDGFNTKFDGLAGSLSGAPLYATSGLLAMPLGYNYGLEFTATGGSLDGKGFGGVGTNLFWRNPAVGRVGIIADYMKMETDISNVDAYRVSAEGQYYFGRFTLHGQAGAVMNGAMRADLSGHTYTATEGQTHFTSSAALDYYLLDDLKVSVGHSYSNDKHAATLGAEWGFAIGDRKSMAALFADASFASAANAPSTSRAARQPVRPQSMAEKRQARRSPGLCPNWH